MATEDRSGPETLTDQYILICECSLIIITGVIKTKQAVGIPDGLFDIVLRGLSVIGRVLLNSTNPIVDPCRV
jgi:hypothetical protein